MAELGHRLRALGITQCQLHVNSLMQDVQSFNSVAEMEKFLLEHGEQVIDVLGAEVDRIELEIKVRKHRSQNM